MAAVVQPRDRLLARVAALREARCASRRGPPRRGGSSRRSPCPRRACRPRSAAARARRRRASASRPRRAPRRDPGSLARDPVLAAEDEQRRVLLGLDLALRGEARRGAGACAHDLAELRLGEQQEVVVARGARREAARSRRAFGVSSSAAHALAAPRRRSRACAGGSPPRPGPATRTNARGRRATRGPKRSATLVSLGSVPLFRSKAEQKVIDAGYDPARLPPGQYLTEKWPVLHAGTVPQVDLATWTSSSPARSSEPLTLTWEQLLELPSREVTVDIHCVTRWSRFDTTLQRRPLARAREARLARSRAAASSSRTPSRASPRTSRSRRSRTRTRWSPTRPTASR